MELNNSKGKCLKIAVIVVAMVNSFFGFSQGPDPTKTDYKRFIPMNPEAKGFHEYGKFMVNSAKGLPDIKIPLFNLELDDVSVPISLTYNASGVKVHDLNGIVGVNWNLLAGGMIYRNIVGRPDEMEDIGWFVNPEPVDIGSWRFSPETHQAELQVFSKNITDNQPDQFGYSFGGKSGAFFFKRNTTELVKKIFDPIDIQMFQVGNYGDEKYLYFEIFDEKGNQYIFGKEKSSRERDSMLIHTLGHMDENRSGEGDTGWKLDKIITNRGNTIEFKYIEYEVNFLSYVTSQRHVQYYPPDYSCILIEPTLTENHYRNCLISSIESSSFKVDFVYKEFGYLLKWHKALDSVYLSVPNLGYTNGYNLGYTVASGNKLYLNSLTEFDKDLNGLPPYYFDYNYEHDAPDIESYSQDYFGYYNGADNEVTGYNFPGTLLYWPKYLDQEWPEVPKADRSVNFEHLVKGTIWEIEYPTGGRTHFLFEPNYECDFASQDTFFGPGLRLRSTFDINESGDYYNGKQYRYSGLTGYKLRQGPSVDSGFMDNYLGENLMGTYGAEYAVFSDDPKIKYRETLDFYYTNIEECFVEDLYRYDDNLYPTITGKIRYEYDAAQNGTSYNTFLTKQTFEKIFMEESFIFKKIENLYLPKTINSLPYYIMNDSYPKYYSFDGTITYINYLNGLIQKTINYSNPQLERQQIYEYSDEGPDTMYTENWYTYDDSTGLLKEKIEDKTGRNIKTKYHYPFNYANSKYPYNRMTEKNMLSQAIEQVRYVNGGAVDSRLTTYQKFGDYYLPAKSYTFNAQTPYSFDPFKGDTIGEYYDVNNPDVEILAYSQGKPKKIKTRDGLYTYYFWDSDYTHIVAKATSELSSVYPFVLDASYAEGVSEINDMVADIKMSLYSLVSNKDIQVTIYTYNRSMGLSSQTDPNGLTGYYEHDGFNRLIRIRDNNGNILQEYDYNYSNQ